MKKILFFETQEFTGATRVTRTLAKAASQDHEVAFAQVGENVREEIESAIEKEKPDILFSSFIQINPDVIEIGRSHSLKVIVRNDYNLDDVLEEVRERAINTYPQADEIIAQTEMMRNVLLGKLNIAPSRIKVIPNPLDKEDILQKASEPNPFESNGNFHFLWVGRKDPIKDLDTLQAAFEIVHRQKPKTDLMLVSDDPNPYKWMKHADCVVISSKSEASPNVLREALFLGTPVVSTDCSPTVRELLDKDNIAPVGDAVQLAEKMIKMTDSRKLH